ncbi:adhesion G protein-coupled receptor F4-like isoform X2 [Syngnathoides biaculeatus]|uniref:adhesion G protein-coupled receptor F4-like isoform X2 n=1 Tax=Syngnathoides biaculeatus TaxID=300417 RepID=UPI002ADDFB85|nr:adhesion G protein-coupled receptor F4-like isoform X2 [Syngnathoides biaculeatus]
MTSLNLTTACYSDFNGIEQCQCEDPYLWPCHICETYGTCSNARTQNCNCINGIPPDGQYCELNITTTCSKPTTTAPPLETTPPSITESSTQVPQTIDERSLSFTMNIEFEDSYNNNDNDVHQRCLRSIQTQSEIHIPGLLSASLSGFRNGSTIGDFEITANTPIQDSDVDALLAAIFNDLRSTFPMIFVSNETLEIQPNVSFFGNTVTVTCGPPPEDLDFRMTSLIWTLNGVLINEDDQHVFSEDNGVATLTITNYFFTDEGRYQCQQFDQNSSFRQDSDDTFRFLETPTIQMAPLQNNILCEVGQQVSLECSVQDPYQVEFQAIPNPETSSRVQHLLTITQEVCDNQELNITCQVNDFPQFKRNLTLMFFTDGAFTCVADSVFGNGFLNEVGRASCELNQVGEKTAICRENGTWEAQEDSCTLQRIAHLLFQSQDVLITTDVLTRDEATNSWDILNTQAVIDILEARIFTPRNESVSSLLLFSLEGITSRLINDSFSIETPLILLNKTTFTNNFNGDFNSTVGIDIEESNGPTNLTVITFESLDNVLPPRDENNSTGRVINGRVVLVQSDTTVDNISFTFDIINDTLGNPQCVFWNFTLFEGLGGWDEEGCELVVRDDETVTCRCDHLTSFSMLMSPFVPNSRVLDYISYIGVGISMASLLICLIIEAFIWKKVRKSNTSHLRHISIVNIALSLLIANIWFIIGASISEGEKKNPDACTAATFFIHFFYLALFFWMLASALLLFYRSVRVFGGGISKNTMMAIGFSLGYGAPLIITVITIAVTAPNNAYIQENVICWLNWERSRALLAFVIPALLIVFINIVILIVVIVKILQSRGMTSTAQEDEKYVLVVIIRSLAILTPFFGITWSLGVGIIIDPSNLGIHITFALFNSLQGFFILVFGTLLDKKVRSEISVFKSSTSSGSGTRTTSSGNSSSGWQIWKNFGRRAGTNLSSDSSSSSQAINT